MQTIVIRITGLVQGVFFRKSTREKALELGITGTVRNLENGSVEIVSTAEKKQLDTLISWCRQGPPKANVSHVEWEECPLQSFSRFEIIR